MIRDWIECRSSIRVSFYPKFIKNISCIIDDLAYLENIWCTIASRCPASWLLDPTSCLLDRDINTDTRVNTIQSNIYILDNAIGCRLETEWRNPGTSASRKHELDRCRGREYLDNAKQ